jgi:hypothetical protein
LARSFGSVNVVVSSERALGASSAAKTPWQARGHQHREAVRGAADGGGGCEATKSGKECRLAADQVGQPTAEQQQAPERQRVRGHDPLPVGVAEPQSVLRRRQREGHHGHVEDDHERGGADDREGHPSPRAGIARVDDATAVSDRLVAAYGCDC